MSVDREAIQSLGIIGLGLVGRALAMRACAAGLGVAGYDVAPTAADAARKLGIALRDDIAALAQDSEALLVCVFDGTQLADVAARALALPSRPRLILHCVTAAPAISEALARDAAAVGTHLIEMPLSGSSRQIGAGEALALVGADPDGWTAAQGLIAMLAPLHVHVGPPGFGARAKLATNLVLGLNRAALAEGLVFAETLGLDGTLFLELLRQSPAFSRAVDSAGPRMVAGDFAPASRIRQHHKDLRLMLAAAAEAGLDLPLSRTHEALLAEAEALGRGELDNAAIVTVLRDRRKSGD